MAFQDGDQFRDERDLALVAGLHLPAQARLVPDAENPGRQIEIVGQQQVAEFARSNAGQEQCEEYGKLSVVAGAKEVLLLPRVHQQNGPGRFDRDPVDL
jgi:hypothetical protein